jgi:hypothetical protein
MTTVQPAGGRADLDRATSASLADVVDTILDKGLVIDAYVQVSLVGIELLTVDARITVASVDTYLRLAEAVNRLDLGESQPKGLPDLVEDVTKGGAGAKTRGVLDAVGEKVRDVVGEDETAGTRRPDRRRSRDDG